jgi:hypothetical protein
LFNWISGDNWNSFNGSTLTFNESKLNASVVNLINSSDISWAALTNYPSACNDYQIGVGDVLTCGDWNSTSPTFVNLTVSNSIKYQNTTGTEKWRTYVNSADALVTEYIE